MEAWVKCPISSYLYIKLSITQLTKVIFSSRLSTYLERCPIFFLIAVTILIQEESFSAELKVWKQFHNHEIKERTSVCF